MPYTHLKQLIPRSLDRRFKLTPEIENDIKQRHKAGEAIRAIARAHPEISRRLIQFVIFPERRELAKKLFTARRKDGRYKPKKETWRETMREHRHYKQALKLKKLLKNIK